MLEDDRRHEEEDGAHGDCPDGEGQRWPTPVAEGQHRVAASSASVRLLTRLSRRARATGHPDVAAVLPWCDLDFLSFSGEAAEMVISAPAWAAPALNEAAGGTKEHPALLARLLSDDDDAVDRSTVHIVEQGSESWRRAAWSEAVAHVRNQGTLGFPGAYGLGRARYKSYSEVVLARELSRRNLPFLPLPLYLWRGETREPDFLVFISGRPIVIEVHGEPWHPAGRTAVDWRRNLVYELAGIEVAILDAAAIRSDPDAAVGQVISWAHAGRVRRAA